MLSHNPLVSIIIPVYNVENYIQRCLCSISKIDYNPFEVILVDDSSQDHSAVIAESFLRSNPNWRILHKAKNEGVTRARISGVEQASGKYIMFVDSDDYVDPSILSKLVSTAEAQKADIVCGGLLYDNGKTLVKDSRCNDTSYDRSGINKLLEKSLIYDPSIKQAAIPPYLCGKLFRNDSGVIITSLKEGIDLDYEEDFIALVYLLLNYVDAFVCLSDPLYYYVLHPGQLTSRHPIVLFKKAILICLRLDQYDNNLFSKQISYRSWLYIKSTLYRLSTMCSFAFYKSFVKSLFSEPILQKYIFCKSIRELPKEIISHPHFLFIKTHLYFFDFLFSRCINRRSIS